MPKYLSRKPANTTKAYIALAATSILWGTTWVASKIAVQKVPALELSAIRQLLAGTIFVVFFLFKGQTIPTFRQFRWITITGIFVIVFNNGFGTWAVKYIPSGLAALINALYPLCVVIIELIFLKKKNANPLTFVGLFLGIAGIVTVFYENAFQQHPAGYGFGIAICFTGMLAWSIGTILVARNKLDMNPYYALGWQMLIGAVIIFLMALSTHNVISLQRFTPQTWGALAYLVIAGSITAFIAFIYSIKNLPPPVAALYAYINPLVATVSGAIILQEKLTVNIFVGSVITLAGVYLVNRSIKKEDIKQV